ncbi:hypothetical protein GIB67_021458 [Kingdonia uniflora]|uniref:KIB1-4 beta-propeller domain-containing protein n=1 Tax=Kingdonia uniflora TaxID=39325 RepID=A0A7J7MMB5_9MAGN|nr:hypothetical protein GIB67_021458 [Kingdonia uniflora]
MPNWAELPEELIGLVVKRLVGYHDLSDYFSFHAVCRAWRSVASEKHYYTGVSGYKVPWLMMAEKEASDIRSFYSLSTKKFINISLPEARRRRCWGSPNGWLITIGIDLEVHLLNPLTHVQIRLPPQTAFKDPYSHKIIYLPVKLHLYSIEKAILLSAPLSSITNDNCIVMVIYSEWSKLAIVKPGDETWTTLESPFGSYEDFLFFRNQVYAFNFAGVLRVCDISSTQPKAVDFASPPKDFMGSERSYLVEVGGNLLLVERIYDYDEDAYNGDPDFYAKNVETIFFFIYKLDLCTRKWEDLECSFGDCYFRW